ncbi:MAG: hypothetical protein L0332_24760, partial [Chloroflexi bacterium]|nr:hypothetical protein [Chloroflexota bacterium]
SFSKAPVRIGSLWEVVCEFWQDPLTTPFNACYIVRRFGQTQMDFEQNLILHPDDRSDNEEHSLLVLDTV